MVHTLAWKTQSPAVCTALEHGFWTRTLFADWTGSKDGTIWITGLPGSGKTLLFSSIVERLRATTPHTTAVVYFFCDHRDHSKISHESFIMTITRQMLDLSPACLEHAKEVYEDESPYPFNRTKYVPLIEKLMSCFQEVLFLVDGLDEASEIDKIAESLTHLHNHGQSTAVATKVLLTSRFDVQMERHFPAITSTRVTLAENMREDIDHFIRKELEIRMSKGTLKLRHQDLLLSVQEQIAKRAGT